MNRDILRSVLIIWVVAGSAAFAFTGTSAFLNDAEVSEFNQLASGEFDLKVDWNQTYNGEWVNAYPVGNNGQAEILDRDAVAQNLFGQDYGNLTEAQRIEAEQVYRDQFADLPDDVDGPIINLTDLKPGDHGEVTFSIHLFNNPGCVWMIGELTQNAENGVTESEADDPDENDPEGPLSGTNQSGELLNTLNATLFYDLDGDNQLDEGEEIILNGSFHDLLNATSQGKGIPLDGNLSQEGRNSYINSTTKYVALQWSMDVDHANEIQGDSIMFDIGFYGEQSRHNNCSVTPTPEPTLPPQETETPTPTPTDTPKKKVKIDVKNMSDPNCINLKNNGNVPVAVFGNASFNVSHINVSTVRFANASAKSIGGGMEDLNNDSWMDVVYHFDTQDLNLTYNSTDAKLTGELNDGTKFYGNDTICIVPKHHAPTETENGKDKGEGWSGMRDRSSWGERDG